MWQAQVPRTTGRENQNDVDRARVGPESDAHTATRQHDGQAMTDVPQMSQRMSVLVAVGTAAGFSRGLILLMGATLAAGSPADNSALSRDLV